MLTEKFKNEAVYRRFLLGEMTENEREKFEAEFLADENIFDEISVAEDELVEAYVRGTLDFETKRKIETNYLKSPKNIEKLEFTRSMLANLKTSNETFEKKENSSFLKSLVAFLTDPKLAFGAAFAILLIIFASWFLLKKPSKNEIVKNATPTPTVKTETNFNSQTNQNSSIEIPVNNVNKENINSNTETKPTPKPTETPKEKIVPNPILALFAGTVRGEGKTNSVMIPKDAKGLNLQMKLESQDYKNYRAEIVDQNGNSIFKSGKIAARNARLNTFISSEKLKKGDYLVKVYGLNAENEEESAADFQFRVNR
ncbi:MAG TPA: hypothetical protein PKY59_19505 [Pyrinomonadaceae bacterium]|nr:hypothetical protein [Pyrinomonadaceae bacterium]